MITDINLKLLRSFEAVARHRSFTRAAIDLKRTQSTVSAQVSELEQQLGVMLIERTSRRVALTAAGEALAVAVSEALRLIHDGLGAARNFGDDRRGRIVIACVPSLSSVLLPSILAAYRCRDKTTRIDVEELTSSEIVTAIGAAAIDFGIGPCIEPSPPDINFTVATEEPLCVLLQAGDATAFGQAVPFDALVSLQLITLSGSVLLQNLLEEQANAHGMRLSSHAEVRHVQTAIGMARAGWARRLFPASRCLPALRMMWSPCPSPSQR